MQSPLTNQQRKKALDKYPLPNIPDLRPPKLDMTMKLLVGKSICAHDSWLQKMQALCLDAYAPLLNLLNEQASGTQPSVEDLSSAVKCSLKLTGNIFSRLTKEGRRKVLVGIHKDLAHMADEEFKQADVLFGEDVVERVKKRHDALKTLRSVKQPFQKNSAQKRNCFGRRENQGFSHQGRYKAGQFKKPRFSFQQEGQSAPTQEGLGDSPPCKRQKIDSAPPSEGGGNLSSNVITHNSVPDWVKTTLINIATIIILTMFQIIIMKILLKQLPELVIYGSTA